MIKYKKKSFAKDLTHKMCFIRNMPIIIIIKELYKIVKKIQASFYCEFPDLLVRAVIFFYNYLYDGLFRTLQATLQAEHFLTLTNIFYISS